MHISGAWLLAIFFASIRLGVVFLSAPWFGGFRVPRAFRVLFTLSLAFSMVTALGLRDQQLSLMPTSVIGVILAAGGEVVLGGLFAFGLECTFAAFQFGGRLIDSQIGFGIANLLDPVTRAQSPLLGVALNMFALMLFFSLDAHYLVVRGLAWSLEAIPPGFANPAIDPAALFAQFGSVFMVGVEVVVAVAVLLFLLDIGIAAMSRTMPQMNVFVISIPLKVLVGMTVLVLSLPYVMSVIAQSFGGIFRFWESVAR